MTKHRPGSSDQTNGGLYNLSEDGRIDSLKMLLTEAEAAVALGISRRTLWTLRNDGKIPFVRIGKCIRYPVQALKEWVDNQNQGPRPNLPK